MEEVRIHSSNKLAKLAETHRQNCNAAFSDEFEVLRRGFPEIESFASFIGDRFKQELLPNDDCTIVVINIGANGLWPGSGW